MRVSTSVSLAKNAITMFVSSSTSPAIGVNSLALFICDLSHDLKIGRLDSSCKLKNFFSWPAFGWFQRTEQLKNLLLLGWRKIVKVADNLLCDWRCSHLFTPCTRSIESYHELLQWQPVLTHWIGCCVA